MPKPLPRTSLEPVCLALAEIIRQQREARGWSRGQLAESTNLARQVISFVESNRRVPNSSPLGHKIRVDIAGGVRYGTPPYASKLRNFMSTFFAKKEEQKPRWYVIDAADKVLGKVAVRAANVLRGKIKPTFTSHVDAGDFVVVVNAEKVVLTGRKETDKVYMSYSQYPGKEKRRSPKQIRATHPEKLIEHAVKGMIPHNRLGRQIITKLKVYKGPAHPHAAQKPEPISL